MKHKMTKAKYAQKVKILRFAPLKVVCFSSKNAKHGSNYGYRSLIKGVWTCNESMWTVV